MPASSLQVVVRFAGAPVMPVRHSPDGALVVYTVLMALITLGFFMWWLISARERRFGLALPLLLIGGALSGLMESWLDNVVLVGYPPHQGLPVLESFGRSVPIFVPIGYAWFCGGLLYILGRVIGARRRTGSFVWALYAVVAFIDFVAIGLSSWIGVLQFFGSPPLNVLGYPVWWAGIDGLDVVLGGIVVAFALANLKGRSQWWLILVPSITLGASAGIVGWPISTALNSSWGEGPKYLCAFATIGLSLSVIRLLAWAVRFAPVEGAPSSAASAAYGELVSR